MELFDELDEMSELELMLELDTADETELFDLEDALKLVWLDLDEDIDDCLTDELLLADDCDALELVPTVVTDCVLELACEDDSELLEDEILEIIMLEFELLDLAFDEDES